MSVIRNCILVFFFLGLSFGGIFFVRAWEFSPEHTISMTGANASVRFDTAEAIYGPPTAGIGFPQYHPHTQQFSWGFYIRNIGWASLSTGSYQVSMSCPNGQPRCRLSGMSWSDAIGEMSWSGVIFNPRSGVFEGGITSYIGIIPVHGISLSLSPIRILEDLSNLSAHHSMNLSIAYPEQYRHKYLELTVFSHETHMSNKYLFDGTKFSGVDVSYAGTYTLTIRVFSSLHTLESTTIFRDITVKPGAPSTTLIPKLHSFLIGKYCKTRKKTWSCPDGSELHPTSIIADKDEAIADGNDRIQFTLKLRDRYGNRVSSWTVRVSYHAPVRDKQVDIWENPWLWSFSGSAFISPQIHRGDYTNFYGDFAYNGIHDIQYEISSRAPTQHADQITLRGISYNKNPITLTWKQELRFQAPWEAQLHTSGEIYAGLAHIFPLQIASNGNHTVPEPEIVGHLTLGDDPYNTYWSIRSRVICKQEWMLQDDTDTRCQWLKPWTFFVPLLSQNHEVAHTPAPHNLLGMYVTNTPNIDHTTSASVYIITRIDHREIVYPSQKNVILGTSTQSSKERIKILGIKKSALLDSEHTGQAEFFNSLRKNLAYLERNTKNYESFPYIFEDTETLTIHAKHLRNKRTIVAIGQDIHISENIIEPEHAPIAIISLSDGGKWGNIIVDDTVSDIEATLIAERGIIAWGEAKDRQLYIYGSVLSANTLWDTPCPYFTWESSLCEKYDLSLLRHEYTDFSQKWAQNPRAQEFQQTPIIIEYDSRIIQNPPPGLYQTRDMRNK